MGIQWSVIISKWGRGIRSVVCMQMHGNCSINQRPENYRNSVEFDLQLNLSWLGKAVTMSWPINYELNLISGVSANARKPTNRSKARKRRKVVIKRDQMLIRQGEATNEPTHQIWTQSNQRFFCKCAETTQPIRDQEMANANISCSH